jgi:hypothetical protein
MSDCSHDRTVPTVSERGKLDFQIIQFRSDLTR